MMRALLLLALALPAYAQSIPSVPDTGPQARDARLGVSFAGDFLPAQFVDVVVRQQSIEYLQRVVASMKPNPPPMTVGVIVGKAMNPSCDGGVYVAGWVVETAARVQVRFDAATIYHEATVTPTMPGYAKGWVLCIPILYHDGREHGIYARALRATGTVIGPIDNAKSATRWKFTIPAAEPTPPPPPPPPPVVAPPFVNGRVSYAAGVVTIEAAPEYARAELLIDSRDIAPWYLGVKTFAGGVVTFAVPTAARDGAEHLLDVRLYKTDLPGVFRPDGYPTRAVLAP